MPLDFPECKPIREKVTSETSQSLVFNGQRSGNRNALSVKGQSHPTEQSREDEPIETDPHSRRH